MDIQETLNYIFVVVVVVVFQRLQSLRVLKTGEGWVRGRNETESVVECQLAE